MSTDFSARLTEAFRPVASHLPPALLPTIVDLHRASGSGNLAGTMAAGARLAGLLSGMPTGRTATSSTATPAAPSADGAPPEPSPWIPDRQAFASEGLWQTAFKAWKLARARWRAWNEKREAKRQARLDAEAEAFRQELERARKGQ